MRSAAVVEVEAPAGGTNKYCSKESDWMSSPGGPGVQMFWKQIRSCTSLKISEIAYEYYSTAESLVKTVRLSDGQSMDEAKFQGWGHGRLNRITGELSAEWRSQQANSEKLDHYDERWSRLFEQIFRLDKWSVCQG